MQKPSETLAAPSGTTDLQPQKEFCCDLHFSYDPAEREDAAHGGGLLRSDATPRNPPHFDSIDSGESVQQSVSKFR